ncbi:hypothetical protein TrVE_jg9213 [Triparma verrucosa]|uniref:ATP-grasp domain-containing protein n=1 Tax=Triparma verrucosa TaxID=1606542 RepID=A0A9W7F9I3_9STRA|nr:hypothetical protein TrVE_jg9213 [Triparma verrucosa]
MILTIPLLLALLLHRTPSILYPSSPPSAPTKAPTEAVILVDPFSELHSQFIKANLLSRNIAVVEVLSPYIANGLNNDTTSDAAAAAEFDYLTLSPDLTDLSSWVSSIESKGLSITSVICESDSGLSYAEELSSLVSRKHNGVNEGRRNKFMMNDICEKSGIDTVKQKLCSTVDEALEAFESDFGAPSTIILKPELGVASENVYKCSTKSEVKSAAEKILNANTWGTYKRKIDRFIVQEYVEGKEYVLDCVSKNGEHKCTAMWVYDKTEFKKYRGTKLVSCDSDETQKMADYIFKALTALGVDWGMTHNEVKITPVGTVKLIEVNCRQHNANIAPVTTMCIGYNTLDAVVSAYVDEDEGLFESMPAYPKLKKGGIIVHLQCNVEGRVKKLKGLEEIENLPSTVEVDYFYDDFGVGCNVRVTESIRTDCGFVIMINDDKEELERDYERICELMKTMIVVGRRRRKRDILKSLLRKK